MDKEILEKAISWSENEAFDQDFRKQISDLIASNNEPEIIDRFYKDLEFGTGGLRGILGAGSNRMNIYTVGRATQGLADYINEWAKKSGESPSVAIAFDSRKMSDVFSRKAACVLAANGIKVHIFPELRPVPMLSFAVRELGTTAGIVITASHNPPEYNGYKVYWSDGCQVITPHDHAIIDKVNSINDFSLVKSIDFYNALEAGTINLIPPSLEESYFSKIESLLMGEKAHNKDFGVVYTPLHGAGNYPVREMLKRRGFENVTVVESQEKPDGNFPTVTSPNPEEPSALQIAQETAAQSDQLIIGTDPDSDRIGVLVKHKDKWTKINGNQIGQLILDYYLSKLKENNRLPDDAYFVTTIVTSSLGEEIASLYGVKTIETLTGFKYIGSVVREKESKNVGTFLFGTEESHGYLLGDFVRDKDGVSGSTIFAELCAELHYNGLTAIDQLENIHRRTSFHSDSLINKVIQGQAGAQKIQDIMAYLRKSPPISIAGIDVKMIKDYQEQTALNCETKEVTEETSQPKSNVLAYYMADGSRITARPSGTEPKIKFYFNLKGGNEQALANMKTKYENEFMAVIDEI